MVGLEDLRHELAQGLAKALAAGGLPESEAAAQSVLRGQGLPVGVASGLENRPVCTLVSFDADRIQSWVFASERVQVGKGASSILEDINARVRKKDLEIPGVTGVAYSAGGGGILFAAGTEQPEVLEDAVRRWLERESHELTFTVVSLPLFARDLLPGGSPQALPAGGAAALDRFSIVDGLRGALVRLQVKVREVKDSRPRFGGLQPQWIGAPGAAIPRCPSCGRRPPQHPEKASALDDGPGSWCEWCVGMRKACRELNHAELYTRNGKPLTFSDFAEASSRRRKYLGFVAIDGNGMGGVVQGVRDLLQLRAFSEATTEIYEKARRQIDGILGSGFLQPGWSSQEANLSLLSGGDEITLVLPAAAAPLAALEILREIEAGFDEQCRPGGLLNEAFAGEPDLLDRLRHAGAAAGVIVAQPQFPVRLLRHYATDLQKQAKQVCGPGAERSAIAWKLLTDSSPLPEGMTQVDDPEDFKLATFEGTCREAAEAAKVGLPLSALWSVLGQCRREEETLRLLPEKDRRRVLALAAANFFRYQIARNDRLKKWWSSLQLPKGAGGDLHKDEVNTWFGHGGAGRLERLVDLLALQAFPGKSVEPEETGEPR